jgi:hypothetical protein
MLVSRREATGVGLTAVDLTFREEATTEVELIAVRLLHEPVALISISVHRILGKTAQARRKSSPVADRVLGAALVETILGLVLGKSTVQVLGTA